MEVEAVIVQVEAVVDQVALEMEVDQVALEAAAVMKAPHLILPNHPKSQKTKNNLPAS